MQILLANAKIMRDEVAMPYGKSLTKPQFGQVASLLAAEMARMEIDELARQLHCSAKIAAENWVRYRDFAIATAMPAMMAYNGQAYKHLRAAELSAGAVDYAQRHLWITCFLYGLLRPLDAVVPYRMECDARLDVTDDKPVHNYWRTVAKDAGGLSTTDVLIRSVKADDGTLLHLSTEEYQHLFHWQQVCSEVNVVQPLFYVRSGGKLKVQAVWAKTCRGAMLRYILENRISDVEELQAFSYEGFTFSHSEKRTNILNLIFVREC